jgi:hypothetical protein
LINLTAPQATVLAALIAAVAASLTVSTSILVAGYNKKKERDLEYAKKLWDSRVSLYIDLFQALGKMKGWHGGWTVPQNPAAIPTNYHDMGLDLGGLDGRVGVLGSDDVAVAWRATCGQFDMIIARARELNSTFGGNKGQTPKEYEAITQYTQQFRIGYELVVQVMRAELNGTRLGKDDKKRLAGTYLARVTDLLGLAVCV